MKIWIAGWLFVTMQTALFAGAYCWKIKEDDLRHYCEAKAEGQNSCWKIKNSDMRAFCESVAEDKKNCWKIKDSDQKNLCEALVKH